MDYNIQEYKTRIPSQVHDKSSLQLATGLLSELNTMLDKITEHKEQKTKPLNEALKKIREDYKPLEIELQSYINEVRTNITQYANKQLQDAKQAEQRILEDKRTNTTTKIEKLSNITQTPTNISTPQGKISFTTVRKYRVTNITHVPFEFLTPNDTLIKEAMKNNQPIAGIEYYEEQSLRNYR